MTNIRQKKINKLRKNRLWPSLMSLLLSIFLAVLAAIFSMSLIISYFAEDRLQATYRDLQQVCQHLSARVSATDDGTMATRLVQETAMFDAAYVIDKDSEVIAGFGAQTFDTSSTFDLGWSGDSRLLIDAEDPYKFFTLNGSLSLPRMLTRHLTAIIKDIDLSNPHQKDIEFDIPFWMSAELDSGNTLLVRFRLYIYKGDFLLAVSVGMLSVGVLLLPIIFLFSNLIFNLFNQRRTTKLLYTDPVTAGHSWIYFEHFGNKSLNSRNRRYRAVIDVAIQKYRSYCICHGMQAGSVLLEKIDRELAAFTAHGEYCAHYGNSNFALLLRCTSPQDCQARVDALMKRLNNLSGHCEILFHVGVCLVDQTDRDLTLGVEEYHNHAYAARASIPDENGSCYVYFDETLRQEQLWEHKVTARMQQAIQNEEFQVYIQPKYNPANDTLAGAEALVRWISPEEGFISPGRFIPIFERNGLITQLDDYMISHVAKLQAEWLAEGKEVVPVSVNVSRAHFANPDLAQHICSLVDVYSLPHHLLEIELTESAFFDDKASLLRTVRTLQDMGFEVSMDDFGSGYSSLNSLKDLPLNVLKLDAGFFHGEDGDKRGEIVVSQAIHLAKQLNMQIVAEGIEKQNQVDFLAENGCDMIQGYFYAKPMPAAEYADRLGSSAPVERLPGTADIS